MVVILRVSVCRRSEGWWTRREGLGVTMSRRLTARRDRGTTLIVCRGLEGLRGRLEDDRDADSRPLTARRASVTGHQPP